jgi:hypothetical protein
VGPSDRETEVTDEDLPKPTEDEIVAKVMAAAQEQGIEVSEAFVRGYVMPAVMRRDVGDEMTARALQMELERSERKTEFLLLLARHREEGDTTVDTIARMSDVERARLFELLGDQTYDEFMA